MSNTANPLNALKIAILSAILTPLTNIQGIFANIEANPTIANVTAQLAVLQGQQLTLILELPALLPTLEGGAISAGAQIVQNDIATLISNLNAQISAAAPPPALVEKAEGADEAKDAAEEGKA